MQLGWLHGHSHTSGIPTVCPVVCAYLVQLVLLAGLVGLILGTGGGRWWQQWSPPLAVSCAVGAMLAARTSLPQVGFEPTRHFRLVASTVE